MNEDNSIDEVQRLENIVHCRSLNLDNTATASLAHSITNKYSTDRDTYVSASRE